MNTDKSEVWPFPAWSNNSTWNPTIFFGNQEVFINCSPCLLGVILNRSLTFNAHLKKLTTLLTSSIRIIRATAHTSWGWCRSTLKMAFYDLVLSKLDYAALAWQPWLSDTNLLFRLSPKLFSLTYHGPTCLYATRSFTIGSQCLELPNLQQPLHTKS